MTRQQIIEQAMGKFKKFMMRHEHGTHVNPDGTKDDWMASPEMVKSFLEKHLNLMADEVTQVALGAVPEVNPDDIEEGTSLGYDVQKDIRDDLSKSLDTFNGV